MTTTDTRNNELPATIYRWLLAGLSIIFVTMSLVEILVYPMSKLVVLGVACLVAALVCRHRLHVPRTKLRVLAKDIFALWAVVWLGISGGVVVGVVASAAAFYAGRQDKRRSLLQISSDTIAVFLVAIIYVVARDRLFNGGSLIGSRQPDPAADPIIAVIVIIAVIHFIVDATLVYLGRIFDGEGGFRQLFREVYLYASLSAVLTLAGVLLANFTFVQFGIEFGVVILAIALIGTAAHIVHHKRLAAKTRQITEASRMHLATVEALATAIDARDQVGIGHVRRTQIFAVGIGEFLELGADEINALRTAALLHDIGKLAVPDHILNKPGALTQAEIEKTKIHSSVGASILEKVGFDLPVVPAVKYHHENWDGTGYPEGLKGENIPLTARILAVADAYDTLRGARPYRPPVSRSEACAILKNDSGRKFDPRLVQVFLDNLRRWENEVERQGLGYSSNRGEVQLQKAAAGGAQQTFVEQIKLANREAFTLYELAREFSSSLNLSETANLFSEKIRNFAHFDTCSIYLLDEKSGTARSVHVAGKHAAIFRDHVVALGEGVTGRVLATQSIARNSDPLPDLMLLRSSVTSDYRSMVSLPLLTEGKLIGAVSLYSTDPVGFGDEHLRLLETICRIAADAIYKSQQHAQAETYALTDPLTGLPNMRSLEMQFDREIARAKRAGTSFHILMLDLDGFKLVNDTFGHKTGDKMLEEVGRVIKSQLREYDFLARYAGDEFVALVPDTEVVYELCFRIERSVSDFALPIGEDIARVGVSVGAATYPNDGDGFDQLVIAADKAMYATKAKRKYAENYAPVIPMPNFPLDLDMPSHMSPDDIDTVTENIDPNIYRVAEVESRTDLR